jgi:cytochrome c peroxidase
MRNAIFALLAGTLALGGAPAQAQDRGALAERAGLIFGTLPEEVRSDANPITEAKIDLGRKLYYEKRLSKNHDISCNSCHLLAEFGVDGESTSSGHRGQRGDRNAPTVYNAALHVAQFWDGRAPDVEEQAKGPVLNAVEMAMPSEQAVVETLESIPGYAPLFSAAFPDALEPISYDNMAKAIGAFERRLLTPSPLDHFQAGKLTALSEEQAKGLELFVGTGCVACHNGPGVGGGMYQRLGAMNPYPTQDLGRFEVTGREEDRFLFKVPSLRNVEKTGPYFHDGGVGTIEEAVRLMANHQLGKVLSDADVGQIVAFLGSLTGAVDPEYIKPPELPPSGPSTGAPDPS